MRTSPVSIGLAAVACCTLVAACASTPAPPVAGPHTDADFRAAHLVCFQQMQATRVSFPGGMPDRHFYRMCMKRKGFEV